MNLANPPIESFVKEELSNDFSSPNFILNLAACLLSFVLAWKIINA